jgi:hypothetical protein
MNMLMRLGRQAHELSGLEFKLAQPFSFAGIHAAVFGGPFVEAGVT